MYEQAMKYLPPVEGEPAKLSFMYAGGDTGQHLVSPPPFPPSRYLLLGTHLLPLRAFEGAMVFLGEKDVDSDEVQCIVANLIEKVTNYAATVTMLCIYSVLVWKPSKG